MMMSLIGPGTMGGRALSLDGRFNFSGENTFNRGDVWSSEIPGAAGITNARGLATIYGATVGEVGNSENSLRKLGKAGARRWRGIRPTVRGVAMNPVDHPHGGGEGKTSGGRSPVSPWGQSAKGLKTRRPKRSDKLIITRRRKRK